MSGLVVKADQCVAVGEDAAALPSRWPELSGIALGVGRPWLLPEFQFTVLDRA